MSVECSYCKGTGWGESDYDPGMFYPCHTCNPKGSGVPSSVVLAVDPAKPRSGAANSRSIPPASALAEAPIVAPSLAPGGAPQ
jgi:hypothetical protein